MSEIRSINIKIQTSEDSFDTVKAVFLDQIDNANMPEDSSEQAVVDELKKITASSPKPDGSRIVPVAPNRRLDCTVGAVEPTDPVDSRISYDQTISCDLYVVQPNENEFLSAKRVYFVSGHVIGNPDSVSYVPVVDLPETWWKEGASVEVFEYQMSDAEKPHAGRP